MATHYIQCVHSNEKEQKKRTPASFLPTLTAQDGVRGWKGPFRNRTFPRFPPAHTPFYLKLSQPTPHPGWRTGKQAFPFFSSSFLFPPFFSSRHDFSLISIAMKELSFPLVMSSSSSFSFFSCHDMDTVAFSLSLSLSFPQTDKSGDTHMYQASVESALRQIPHKIRYITSSLAISGT